MSITALAQQSTIHGTVVDANEKPLTHVLVMVADNNLHLYSDSLGHFHFNVAGGATYKMSFSRLGFKPLERVLTVKSAEEHVHVQMKIANNQLSEVQVKDRFADERKQTESMNVEVVSADFIQRNLGGSLMGTLSRLPGIKTIGIGSGQSKPLIRGLGFNRVVVTDKGIKHEGQQWGADHGLELDQFAAGEVELIKGAASFVYGSDAIGGVIDVKPALPPAANATGGFVDLIGKSNNNLLGTSVNVFSRKSNWFFDSRFTYQNYGDYRVPTDTVQVYNYPVTLNNNFLRNTAGRETGLHLNTGYISKNSRSVFYISNVYANSGFFANAHGLEPRRVNTEQYDQSNRDIMLPSQQVNHFKVINRSQLAIGKHLLQADLGYQHNFRQEFSQYVNHGYMPPDYPASMTIPVDLEREFNKKVYSLNLRDKLTLNNHEVTIGFNGEHQDNGISGWGFLVPAFNQTTAGIFAYDKFKLSDKVLLHAALRYDHGKLNTFRYTDWFPTEGENLVRADNLKRNFNSLVWSLGVNYTPNNPFSLKANVGKSFRMPIAKELSANGVNYHYFSYERGNPNLNPEQSYQADLTLAWSTARWNVQLSPFYNYFPNYIYLNPTADLDYLYGAGNQVFNYQESRVSRYGGELQVRYNIASALSVEVLGEYLYAEQLSGDKAGYTLPFSPPPSALFNLTYQPAKAGILISPYLSVDYRITAKQNNIVPPERETPGYHVWNIQAGAKLRAGSRLLNFSLQVQNVLNTRYLNHTSFYRLISLPEAGRNIILSVKVPFGRSNSQ
ncbi:TonB-dependent receptor [Mucilaginibacter roseus]|uniref:TonB-dependent receptor n=1 Tax=Mucilaginibacter roseus TaxID=1528868 RepID=A0ABS8TZQ9_9SPHI|nr:TonB-dependent receptor [Mucilaginibacter roseus]MCD8739295.1 TonB-dependent receptor [Mucilaginibacter roseus]